MTDHVLVLAAIRTGLDAAERQAKAAEGFWCGMLSDLAGEGPVSVAEREHIATWSPAAVLALCGWIRQTLDGAEATLHRHQMVKRPNTVMVNGEFLPPRQTCRWTAVETFPCPDYTAAASVIAGLAAVLAPDQAVKP